MNAQRMKLGPCLTPHLKIKSKLIKDLNVRAKSIKLLEENTGGKQSVMTLEGVGNDFLAIIQKHRQ